VKHRVITQSRLANQRIKSLDCPSSQPMFSCFSVAIGSISSSKLFARATDTQYSADTPQSLVAVAHNG
jgi:hypothetical protein